MLGIKIKYRSVQLSNCPDGDQGVHNSPVVTARIGVNVYKAMSLSHDVIK
jgi:hypothetical protein